MTNITADKDGTAATVTVGYHPDYATRLDGRRFDFFVSLAFRSQAQTTEADPACR